MARFHTAILCLCILVVATAASAQGVKQSEEEFQSLMPITGTVETYFGDFELDHSK